MVEEDEGAEAESYPPREVRLVQPGDPEGEAEDGEVDLLRRVGVGGADVVAGGEGTAAGCGCELRDEESLRGGGGRL